MRAHSLAGARGITWLIFIDDLHVDFRNTGHFRNLIKVIAGELVDEDDAFMVRSSGPSNLSVERTSDRARLVAAARTATGNGLKPSDIIRSPQRADGPNEVRYRAAVAFAAAKELLDATEALSGTPIVLTYVSNGYDIDVSPRPEGAMETTEFPAPTLRISAARVRDQFWDLTGTAQRANVRIFAIDPRTLPDAPREQGWDPVAWQDHWTTTQGTLSQLSETTGGFAVLDAGDVIAAVRQIRQTVAGFPVKPLALSER